MIKAKKIIFYGKAIFSLLCKYKHRKCPILKHSGQIFSFVQRSRGVLSHALIRSNFLLKLTNQVPSLCLLPRFAAKLRPFLTVLTTIPKKRLYSRLCRFSSRFQREKILHTSDYKCFRHRHAIAKIGRFVRF